MHLGGTYTGNSDNTVLVANNFARQFRTRTSCSDKSVLYLGIRKNGTEYYIVRYCGERVKWEVRVCSQRTTVQVLEQSITNQKTKQNILNILIAPSRFTLLIHIDYYCIDIMSKSFKEEHPLGRFHY